MVSQEELDFNLLMSLVLNPGTSHAHIQHTVLHDYEAWLEICKKAQGFNILYVQYASIIKHR
ncbi:Protein of unknown function [Pyronema omphalodes CBS 100304]|uniref:Uncharacterized protein n=1 Tax=Pyronema omphalodes (strain CBS 100304) TaxID=1076935 RepID=U4LJF1_PYROM|nr:Protein of unknown function [Pyronema omphalodes CBS 100304]